MELRAFSLDFAEQGGVFFPKDRLLHKLALEFAAREIRDADKLNFTEYNKVIAVAELDEDDVPQRVTGLMCGTARFDWDTVRFLDDKTGEKMFDRARAYLEDRGQRGLEALVHVADHEPKESRCPHWRKWLKKMGAVKASRWLVRI